MENIHRDGGSTKCRADTKNGNPCRAPATNSGYCNLHSDRGRAAELGRLGGLSNRHSPSRVDNQPLEIPQSGADLRLLLAEAIAEVRAGRLDPKIGTAIAYIANPLLKAIELEDIEIKLKDLLETTDGEVGK